MQLLRTECGTSSFRIDLQDYVHEVTKMNLARTVDSFAIPFKRPSHGPLRYRCTPVLTTDSLNGLSPQTLVHARRKEGQSELPSVQC